MKKKTKKFIERHFVIHFPDDLENEDFKEKGRVHNWRNYVDKSIKDDWSSLTQEEKEVVFIICASEASAEEWD